MLSFCARRYRRTGRGVRGQREYRTIFHTTARLRLRLGGRLSKNIYYSSKIWGFSGITPAFKTPRNLTTVVVWDGKMGIYVCDWEASPDLQMKTSSTHIFPDLLSVASNPRAGTVQGRESQSVDVATLRVVHSVLVGANLIDWNRTDWEFFHVSILSEFRVRVKQKVRFFVRNPKNSLATYFVGGVG